MHNYLLLFVVIILSLREENEVCMYVWLQLRWFLVNSHLDPFIRVHILMNQTQNKRQEARSALNTVISSSKRTTRVSSSSPPLGHLSPHTQFLSSSNDPGGGRGMASPGLTCGEHWWQDDGKLEGSFVACLASPLAGHWLNQDPGVRPSAGAAVGFYPQWVWMCPWEKML